MDEDSAAVIGESMEAAASRIAEALKHVFISPNVADSNMEPANIVDALDKIAHAIGNLADAVRGLKA